MPDWLQIILAIGGFAAVCWFIGSTLTAGMKRREKASFWCAVAICFVEAALCGNVLGRFDRLFFALMFVFSWFIYREHRKNEKTGMYKDGEILPPFHHLMFTWLFFAHVVIGGITLLHWVFHSSLFDGVRR